MNSTIKPIKYILDPALAAYQNALNRATYQADNKPAPKSKELTDPAEINAMMDPTGSLQRAGLYNPLPE